MQCSQHSFAARLCSLFYSLQHIAEGGQGLDCLQYALTQRQRIAERNEVSGVGPGGGDAACNALQIAEPAQAFAYAAAQRSVF